MNRLLRNPQGFTLIEILLVVAAIALLAGIIILAINPSKQIGETRNAVRKADVNTIINAVYQYSIDNGGTIPGSISTSETEICRTTASSCSGFIDLAVLTNSGRYLVSMPVDPSVSTTSSPTGTGYSILKDSNNRIIVNASHAELGATISVKR